MCLDHAQKPLKRERRKDCGREGERQHRGKGREMVERSLESLSNMSRGEEERERGGKWSVTTWEAPIRGFQHFFSEIKLYPKLSLNSLLAPYLKFNFKLTPKNLHFDPQYFFENLNQTHRENYQFTPLKYGISQ